MGKYITFHDREGITKYLGISRQYLYRLEKTVRINGSQGTHVGVISKSDIDEWVKDNWRIDWYVGQKRFLPQEKHL